MQNSVAFILARGGSKRIPRKNLRIFRGLPIIAWPIRAARASRLFQRIIVSTDDKEIAETALAFGAECPELRPASLSSDFSTTVEVLRYLLNFFSDREEHFSRLCCLYGTSAFLTPELLRKGKLLLEEPPAACVMAVSAYAHPVERSLRIDEKGLLFYNDRKAAVKRTQDLPVAYHDLGLLYWLDAQALSSLQGNSFASLPIRPLILPRNRVVDIDNEEDWAFAEHVAAFLDEGIPPLSAHEY